MPGLLSPDHTLHTIAEDLARQFAGTFAPETVERYVFESYPALARTAKVSAHLPALTALFAPERLVALAQAKGAAPHDVPEVLIVCVQNAGRSQMAAALLDHHAAGRVHVRSAGSTSARPGPLPSRRSTRVRSRPWQSWAWTSPRHSPSP